MKTAGLLSCARPGVGRPACGGIGPDISRVDFHTSPAAAQGEKAEKPIIFFAE